MNFICDTCGKPATCLVRNTLETKIDGEVESNISHHLRKGCQDHLVFSRTILLDGRILISKDERHWVAEQEQNEFKV